MIENIVAKVEHVKYMEEIERKIKPYVVLDTTEQALQCIGAGELKYDNRIDDHYLSQQWQDYDAEEPISLGIDRMAPEREIKYRDKLPTVLISLDENTPRDELFTQKTILTIKKNRQQSSQSVSQTNGGKSALLKTS